jgi:hypothetical protein
MGSQKPANRRQCPDCSVTLTRYEWSRLWWMSSMMSGRLVQPCTECGARLRLSSMALLSTISALGLIGTSIMYLVYRESTLLYIALVLTLLMLVSMLSTRLEKVPSSSLPREAVPPPREHA